MCDQVHAYVDAHLLKNDARRSEGPPHFVSAPDAPKSGVLLLSPRKEIEHLREPLDAVIEAGAGPIVAALVRLLDLHREILERYRKQPSAAAKSGNHSTVERTGQEAQVGA